MHAAASFTAALLRICERSLTHLVPTLVGPLAEIVVWAREGAQELICSALPARAYLMCMPVIARAITSCWISAVPSKMS